MTMIPAYGRDYKSKAEVQKAWDDGEDFKVVGFGGGGYVTKDDAPAGSHNIRFAKQRKVCVVRK
jgi:hypothetical protein